MAWEAIVGIETAALSSLRRGLGHGPRGDQQQRPPEGCDKALRSQSPHRGTPSDGPGNERGENLVQDRKRPAERGKSGGRRLVSRYLFLFISNTYRVVHELRTVLNTHVNNYTIHLTPVDIKPSYPYKRICYYNAIIFFSNCWRSAYPSRSRWT